MLESILITEEKTIVDAMHQLEKTSKKVLFVVKENQLRASVTDGDIRRWIMKNGSLTASIKDVANYAPKYLYQSEENNAECMMKRHSIDVVPIVDHDKKIQKIIFKDSQEMYFDSQKIDVPVVMMAGGLGSRLSPYTNILPKPLIPIKDIPISERIINRFCMYGCSRYYMIINYKRNMIKAYYDDLQKNYSLDYVIEEQMLGTGGGISLLKGRINETFILTNCDILIYEDITKIYNQHKRDGNVLTMVCALKKFKIPYGVVHLDETGALKNIEEKPEQFFLTNTGCYIVEPQVIDEIDYNVPIDFPDIIEKCRNKGYRVGIYPIGDKNWSDMGQFDQLEDMVGRLNA